MGRNLVSQWMKPGYIEAEIQALLADPQYDEDRGLDQLSHRMVMNGHRSRYAAGEMTGEWLIYVEHQARNLYLTLGRHTEGDACILERVELAAAQFGVAPSDWRSSLP